jgi:hypothetical protein
LVSDTHKELLILFYFWILFAIPFDFRCEFFNLREFITINKRIRSEVIFRLSTGIIYNPLMNLFIHNVSMLISKNSAIMFTSRNRLVFTIEFQFRFSIFFKYRHLDSTKHSIFSVFVLFWFY